MRAGTLYILLTGNTYAAREEIKERDGEFDGERATWVLLAPKDKKKRAEMDRWLDSIARRGVRVEEV